MGSLFSIVGKSIDFTIRIMMVKLIFTKTTPTTLGGMIALILILSDFIVRQMVHFILRNVKRFYALAQIVRLVFRALVFEIAWGLVVRKIIFGLPHKRELGRPLPLLLRSIRANFMVCQVKPILRKRFLLRFALFHGALIIQQVGCWRLPLINGDLSKVLI